MSNIDELSAMLNENAEVARNDGCPLTAGQYEAAAEALVSMAEALAGIEQTAREYVRNWPNSPTVRAPWEAVLAALAKARGEQG